MSSALGCTSYVFEVEYIDVFGRFKGWKRRQGSGSKNIIQASKQLGMTEERVVVTKICCS